MVPRHWSLVRRAATAPLAAEGQITKLVERYVAHPPGSAGASRFVISRSVMVENVLCDSLLFATLCLQQIVCVSFMV